MITENAIIYKHLRCFADYGSGKILIALEKVQRRLAKIQPDWKM